jgi:hypothetical protein
MLIAIAVDRVGSHVVLVEFDTEAGSVREVDLVATDIERVIDHHVVSVEFSS